MKMCDKYVGFFYIKRQNSKPEELKMHTKIIMFIIISFVSVSYAADPLKPFVLAEEASGSFTDVKSATKGKLEGAGFRTIASYQPYGDTHVFVVTNDKLIESAKKSSYGAWGAVQRVTVTKIKEGSGYEVAYMNPLYVAQAYRMDDDLSWLNDSLKKALGFVKEYGSKVGLTPDQIRKYHYTTGMEHFDEWLELADWDDYGSATSKVKASVAAHKGGVNKVHELEIPGGNQMLFGISFTQGVAKDETLMSSTYCGGLHHTPHLPYEILVRGGKVIALAPRFRIALSFPDLKMVGRCSFVGIMQSPDDINKALTQAAGKEYIVESEDELDF